MVNVVNIPYMDGKGMVSSIMQCWNPKVHGKWMVGIRRFPFGMAYFRTYVCFREGKANPII